MPDSPNLRSPTADEIAEVIRPMARDTADLRGCAMIFTQSDAARAALIILLEIPHATLPLRVARYIIDPFDTLYMVDFLRQRLHQDINEDVLNDLFLPQFELNEQLLLIRTRRISEIMTESIEKHLSDPATLREDLAYRFARMLLSQTAARYNDLRFSPELVEAELRDLITLTPAVRRRFGEICEAMEHLSNA